MVKITFDLNDQLLRQARDLAARNGLTLTGFIEGALRERIATVQNGKEPFRMQLETIKGDQPPSVDVSDRDALYDVMDRPQERLP